MEIIVFDEQQILMNKNFICVYTYFNFKKFLL